jgi:hypothetical protein
MNYADAGPDNTDYFACVTCTAELGYEGNSPVFHLWDETPKEHQPAWNRSLTLVAQLEMLNYDRRIGSGPLGHKIIWFMHRRFFEALRGYRSNEDIIDPRVIVPVFQNLAKRSDSTCMPMFPEEFADWVQGMREAHDFPMYLLDTPVYKEYTFREALTQGELFALCAWINEKMVGAGSQMFAGPLLIKDMTEEKIEQALDRGERGDV